MPRAADLKPALARALNSILQPVRDHFTSNKEAAALLKQVRSLDPHGCTCPLVACLVVVLRCGHMIA